MGVGLVLSQILVIFLLMGIGYIAVKLKIFSPESTRDITVFIISFVIPAVIISAFLKPLEKSELSALLWSIGFNFMYFVLLLVLEPLLFNKKRVLDEVKCLQMRYAFIYSNNGFMGLPLLLAVFGPTAGFFAGVQVAIGNGFMWSHGIGIFRKASGEKASLLKIISNPNIVALFCGLAIYFFAIPLPELLKVSLGYVAQLNTPLSMIIVGSSIAMIDFRHLKLERSLWLMSIVRNLVIPIVVLSFFVLISPLIDFPPLAASVIVIMSACPVAAMVTIMSKLYGFDESYPTKLISLSTLLSLVSLPLMVVLCMKFLF